MQKEYNGKGNAAICDSPGSRAEGQHAHKKGEIKPKHDRREAWKTQVHNKKQRRGQGHARRRSENYAHQAQVRAAVARRDRAQDVANSNVNVALARQALDARRRAADAEARLRCSEREGVRQKTQRDSLERALRQEHPSRWEWQGIQHVLDRETWRMRRDERTEEVVCRLHEKVRLLKMEKKDLQRQLRGTRGPRTIARAPTSSSYTPQHVPAGACDVSWALDCMVLFQEAEEGVQKRASISIGLAKAAAVIGAVRGQKMRAVITEMQRRYARAKLLRHLRRATRLARSLLLGGEAVSRHGILGALLTWRDQWRRSDREPLLRLASAKGATMWRQLRLRSELRKVFAKWQQVTAYMRCKEAERVNKRLVELHREANQEAQHLRARVGAYRERERQGLLNSSGLREHRMLHFARSLLTQSLAAQEGRAMQLLLLRWNLAYTEDELWAAHDREDAMEEDQAHLVEDQARTEEALASLVNQRMNWEYRELWYQEEIMGLAKATTLRGPDILCSLWRQFKEQVFTHGQGMLEWRRAALLSASHGGYAHIEDVYYSSLQQHPVELAARFPHDDGKVPDKMADALLANGLTLAAVLEKETAWRCLAQDTKTMYIQLMACVVNGKTPSERADELIALQKTQAQMDKEEKERAEARWIRDTHLKTTKRWRGLYDGPGLPIPAQLREKRDAAVASGELIRQNEEEDKMQDAARERARVLHSLTCYDAASKLGIFWSFLASDERDGYFSETSEGTDTSEGTGKGTHKDPSEGTSKGTSKGTHKHPSEGTSKGTSKGTHKDPSEATSKDTSRGTQDPSEGTSKGTNRGTQDPSEGTSKGTSKGTHKDPSEGTSKGTRSGTQDPSEGTSKGTSKGTHKNPSEGTSKGTSRCTQDPSRGTVGRDFQVLRLLLGLQTLCLGYCRSLSHGCYYPMSQELRHYALPGSRHAENDTPEAADDGGRRENSTGKRRNAEGTSQVGVGNTGP